MSKLVVDVEDLDVYQLAFDLQQNVFEMSKKFPREEMYSLTDQIRRSSRSVGANIREAWAKRDYVAHFRSKMTDAAGEASETCHWIKTAFACEYIAESEFSELTDQYRKLGAMINKMATNAEAWCRRKG
jgi:four helix bundle protein